MFMHRDVYETSENQTKTLVIFLKTRPRRDGEAFREETFETVDPLTQKGQVFLYWKTMQTLLKLQ